MEILNGFATLLILLVMCFLCGWCLKWELFPDIMTDDTKIYQSLVGNSYKTKNIITFKSGLDNSIYPWPPTYNVFPECYYDNECRLKLPEGIKFKVTSVEIYHGIDKGTGLTIKGEFLEDIPLENIIEYKECIERKYQSKNINETDNIKFFEMIDFKNNKLLIKGVEIRIYDFFNCQSPVNKDMIVKHKEDLLEKIDD